MNPYTQQVAELAKRIVETRSKNLKAQINRYPRRMVYASDVPLCARQGYYAIVEWEKKPLHDEHLQARFNEGKAIESFLIGELSALGREVGFEIAQQQSPLPDDFMKEFNITGRIEGTLMLPRVNGQPQEHVLFEIKSAHPAKYDGLESIQDVIDDPFYRKYYSQLQVYMAARKVGASLLIFTDCLGHWKVFPVEYDEIEVRRCKEMAGRIMAAVEAKVEPERIPFDPDICEKCAFQFICLPDIVNKSAQVVDSPKIAELLKRREELKTVAAEYKKVDESLKESLKNIPMAVIGNFAVTGKIQRRSGFVVNPSEFWVCKIKRVGTVEPD